MKELIYLERSFFTSYYFVFALHIYIEYNVLSMRVLVINNDGGGFADYVEIAEGTTVHELFDQQIRSADPGNYLIRVNRQPVPAGQVLREGDRVSITPTKIEGA